jgi:type II secretory pathway component PulF
MAVYAWRGRNARGEAVQGQLDATNENDVADQLMAMGVAPVHIAVAAELTTAAGDNWLVRLGRAPVVVEDVLVFSRQMYTLNKAGVPILRAFAGLEASSTKPAMVELLKDIRSSLDQGRELSAALARHLDVFGAFYISMIRVGEMTGRLTEVFLRLNEHHGVRARCARAHQASHALPDVCADRDGDCHRDPQHFRHPGVCQGVCRVQRRAAADHPRAVGFFCLDGSLVAVC